MSLTYEQLKEAQAIAARVVATFGDIYLPIFERMTMELEKAERIKNSKQLALEIAKSRQ